MHHSKEYKDLYRKTIQWLAKRDYSRDQLTRKLFQFGSLDLIEDVLNALTLKGLLSEERLAETILNRLSERGYGPNFIRAKMNHDRIPRHIIDSTLQNIQKPWDKLATRQRAKHYGEALPKDPKNYYKQQNYLLRRGFSQDSSKYALTHLDVSCETAFDTHYTLKD